MRLLLIGACTVALSGCAWMGSGHAPYQYGSHSSYQYQYGYNQGYYAGPQQRTHFDASIAAEEFTGGNIVPSTSVGGVNTVKNELNDVYKTGWRASAGIHHDVAPRTTLTFDGFYKEADSEGDRLALTTDGTDSTYGSFTDYKSYGAEVGFREYATNYAPGRLRPYVGGTVGAAYVESIDAVNVSLDQTGTTGEQLCRFMKDSGFRPPALLSVLICRFHITAQSDWNPACVMKASATLNLAPLRPMGTIPTPFHCVCADGSGSN